MLQYNVQIPVPVAQILLCLTRCKSVRADEIDCNRINELKRSSFFVVMYVNIMSIMPRKLPVHLRFRDLRALSTSSCWWWRTSVMTSSSSRTKFLERGQTSYWTRPQTPWWRRSLKTQVLDRMRRCLIHDGREDEARVRCQSDGNDRQQTAIEDINAEAGFLRYWNFGQLGQLSLHQCTESYDNPQDEREWWRESKW